MLYLLTLIIISLVTLLYLSQRKKRSLNQRLIGATALVHSTLNPEGTVLLNGEMWVARSRDGSSVNTLSQVVVTGTQDHLLLVEIL
ncbi:MAG TPA: NfeD family protein [Pyrinomonadaceae bacterium]|jgi:membrane-bound ClpP family serine protease